MKLSKLVLSLAIIMSCQVAQANVAFDIFGRLALTSTGAQIETKFGSITLSELKSDLRSCEDGVYTVVSNYAPQNTYTLLEIVKCNDIDLSPATDTEKLVHLPQPVFCPENYAPVCGRPLNEPYGDIAAPRTYSNICFMKAAGALKIMNGECSERLNQIGTTAIALKILKNLPH